MTPEQKAQMDEVLNKMFGGRKNGKHQVSGAGFCSEIVSPIAQDTAFDRALHSLCLCSTLNHPRELRSLPGNTDRINCNNTRSSPQRNPEVPLPESHTLDNWSRVGA